MSEGVYISKICKAFWSANGERVPALEDITFEAPMGSITALLGPSGCGKSTLLSIVAGLEASDAGVVRLNVSGNQAPCMVFQAPALFEWLTVFGNVEFGLKRMRIPGRERRAAVKEMLEWVGLDGFERAYPGELSGGMQQRVALARALVLRPEILLMDEPFAALDAQLREDMQELLLRMWQGLGITILFVTHDIEEALRLAHRIVIFSARPGRIREVIDSKRIASPECRAHIRQALAQP